VTSRYNHGVNSQDLFCSIELAPAKDAELVVDNLRAADVGRVIETASSAFIGTGLVEIIVLLSSSGAIAATAKVLVAWLEAHKERTIKINKVELKGYSEEEAVRLLTKITTKQSNR
jgi:hypothetical protein